MAETGKVLNPNRTVILPDMEAGCSLVDACRAQDIQAFRARHPDYVIVSYINTSVEVKAESDIHEWDDKMDKVLCELDCRLPARAPSASQSRSRPKLTCRVP